MQWAEDGFLGGSYRSRRQNNLGERSSESYQESRKNKSQHQSALTRLTGWLFSADAQYRLILARTWGARLYLLEQALAR